MWQWFLTFFSYFFVNKQINYFYITIYIVCVYIYIFETFIKHNLSNTRLIYFTLVSITTYFLNSPQSKIHEMNATLTFIFYILTFSSSRTCNVCITFIYREAHSDQIKFILQNDLIIPNTLRQNLCHHPFCRFNLDRMR